MSELRARIDARRRALGDGEIESLSWRICESFARGCGIDHSQWKGKRVALYRALPHELSLKALEAQLVVWGARLGFPRVTDLARREMEFADGLPGAAGAGSDPSLAAEEGWPQGAFGIQEPPAHHPAVDPSEIDYIFVPGSVFGESGERLGMGGGFYDRFLPRAPKALRIALAFDFQVVPKIDQNPWDQRMDWIWTEKRQIRLK